MIRQAALAAGARKVVLAGFVTGILCSFAGTQILGEFGPDGFLDLDIF